MLKKCIDNVDTKKACQMLIGVSGIYVSFLMIGILYEKITSSPYLNSQTNQQQYFRIPSGFIMIERAVNWLLGSIYMHFTIPKDQRVIIPIKNSAIVGFLIFISTISQTQAMYLVSYPLIMMAKACSLISVILVGVCCSRVRSKQLKLGPQKIIIAVIVTSGIIMFRLFDPAANFEQNKSTQLFGLLLLLVSLFVDGFVPDFQAQIKDKYNPSPIEMLLTLNKWSSVCAFIYLTVMLQIKDFVQFGIYHPQLVRDLALTSIFSFIGQIFIYRMIKMFKQHIVPFVTTTRKILTVGLSIVYYHHQTSIGQILSIVVVLSVTAYEFFSNITKGSGEQKIEEQKPTSHAELAEQNEPTPNPSIKDQNLNGNITQQQK